MMTSTVFTPSVQLAAKHDWVSLELERFRSERRPVLGELPADVAGAVRAIHENVFDSQLNVKTLKRRQSIRNNNFSTHFRRIVGIGLRDYIEALRLEAAERLLRNPELEIYLVAMAVGYEHPETFCRAFCRRLGVTPQEWRIETKEEVSSR
ncbi:MAG: helix-turn-helix transcriptional regulator [Thermoanaerobaculia bacterium]|nr:helix-turn-helix transcriptional regulator [Thermoanaerobaculia bacterium]